MCNLFFLFLLLVFILPLHFRIYDTHLFSSSILKSPLASSTYHLLVFSGFMLVNKARRRCEVNSSLILTT